MQDPNQHQGWQDRLKELFEQGRTVREIQKDPIIHRTLLSGIDKETSQLRKIYKKLNKLAQSGIIGCKASEPTISNVIEQTEQPNNYENYVRAYEAFIGAPSKVAAPAPKTHLEEYVVFSDLHLPYVRKDLLTTICERHQGCEAIIAGDIFDFSQFSKFEQREWGLPHLQQLMAEGDALLNFLSGYFPKIRVLLGNHDARLWRLLSSRAGPDFIWLATEYLKQFFQRRHGVELIEQKIQLENGLEINGLYYFLQVGDCIVSHAEASGAAVGKGAEKAHDFFFQWQNQLGLQPFNVVLQAHTHKQSHFRHRLTQAHCFEIGSMCSAQPYALSGKPNWAPSQSGYFHLVQSRGVSDVNASRLFSFS